MSIYDEDFLHVWFHSLVDFIHLVIDMKLNYDCSLSSFSSNSQVDYLISRYGALILSNMGISNNGFIWV